MPSAGPTRSILWLSLSRGIGDAVLLYPSVKRCAELFPGDRVSVALGTESARAVFKAYGFAALTPRVPRTWAGAVPWALRQGPFSSDIVFDASSAEQMHLSRWIARFLARKQCIGYRYGSSSWLYTRRVGTQALAGGHMKDIYAGLLGPVAGNQVVSLVRPETVPERNGRGRRGVRAPLIVVHPGARDGLSSFEKRWPIGRYDGLIGKLLAAFPGDIAVVGDGNERQWLEENLGCLKLDKVTNRAGTLDIAGLFELIASARLFIGNNSGPLHIAAACQTPIVTFAGGVPQSRWGVAASPRTVTLGIDKRCSMCTEYACPDRGLPCLQAVSVEEAFAAARSVWDSGEGTGT